MYAILIWREPTFYKLRYGPGVLVCWPLSWISGYNLVYIGQLPGNMGDAVRKIAIVFLYPENTGVSVGKSVAITQFRTVSSFFVTEHGPGGLKRTAKRRTGRPGYTGRGSRLHYMTPDFFYTI